MLGQHASGLDVSRAVTVVGDEGSIDLNASVGVGTAEVRLGREKFGPIAPIPPSPPFLDPRR